MKSLKILTVCLSVLFIYGCAEKTWDLGPLFPQPHTTPPQPVPVPEPPKPGLITLEKIQNYLFAGISDGNVYRSLDDDGATWKLLNNGMFGAGSYLEAVTDDGKIFVTEITNNDHNLYISNNYGNSWTQSSYLPESSKPMGALSVFPQDNNNIFITTSLEKPGVFTVRTIIKSSDGGTSWQTVYLKECEDWISIVPIVFHQNGDIFALGNPILKSTDNGLRWDSVGTFNRWYKDFNPRHAEISTDNKIYLLFDDCYLYVSNDLCQSWTELRQNVRSFSICKNLQIFIVDYTGSPYKSTDCGATWRLASLRGGANIYISRDEKIFIYDAYCIEKSTDYGNTWDIISTPCFGN